MARLHSDSMQPGQSVAPMPYMLRGMFTSRLDARAQATRVSVLLGRMGLPDTWALQPTLYNQTTDCSFEVVSDTSLALRSNMLRQAATAFCELKVAHLEEANISLLEMCVLLLHEELPNTNSDLSHLSLSLTEDAARDLSKFDGQSSHLFAVALDPRKVGDTLKSRAEALYNSRRSNYIQWASVEPATSVTASTATLTRPAVVNVPTSTASARTGPGNTAAGSSSSKVLPKKRPNLAESPALGGSAPGSRSMIKPPNKSTAVSGPSNGRSTGVTPARAPVLASSAGPSRAQHTGTIRGTAIDAMDATTRDVVLGNKTFEAENLARLRILNERLGHKVDRLERENAELRKSEEEKNKEIRNANAKIEVLEDSKKRLAEDKAEGERALKKARAVERKILPAHRQARVSDDELDANAETHALMMKEEIQDLQARVAQLEQENEELREEKEGLEGDVNALGEEVEYLEEQVPPSKRH
ncbi:unnamed protein product [Peniophora sp. CBMAI 1063]|nr:unnamed protein product [Peniophora sp. CBMAI 1063]